MVVLLCFVYRSDYRPVPPNRKARRHRLVGLTGGFLLLREPVRGLVEAVPAQVPRATLVRESLTAVCDTSGSM